MFVRKGPQISQMFACELMMFSELYACCLNVSVLMEFVVVVIRQEIWWPWGGCLESGCYSLHPRQWFSPLWWAKPQGLCFEICWAWSVQKIFIFMSVVWNLKAGRRLWFAYWIPFHSLLNAYMKDALFFFSWECFSLVLEKSFCLSLSNCRLSDYRGWKGNATQS